MHSREGAIRRQDGLSLPHVKAPHPKALSPGPRQPDAGMHMATDMVPEFRLQVGRIMGKGERPRIHPAHLTDAGLPQQDLGNHVVIALDQHPVQLGEFLAQTGERLPLPVDVTVEQVAKQPDAPGLELDDALPQPVQRGQGWLRTDGHTVLSKMGRLPEVQVAEPECLG